MQQTEDGVDIAYTWDGGVLATTGTEGTAHYFHDELGSPIRLVDGDGVDREVYGYDEFGQDLYKRRSETQPFGYTGYSYDSVSRTYFAQAREYMPEAGRFTSEDPIKSGNNWFVYCNNNSINYVDPLGLESLVVSCGRYDSHGNPYQYEFIDSALLQLSQMDADATWLVATAGWTDAQMAEIKKAADARNINMKWFNNTSELKDYINTGSTDGIINTRVTDKITDFYVFSHGTIDEEENYFLDFGYDTDNADLKLYTSKIDDIYKSAFSSSISSTFYSCRTGNDFVGGNFAQAWANRTNGDVLALAGTDGLLDAGRSTYTDISGDKYQRHIAAGTFDPIVISAMGKVGRIALVFLKLLHDDFMLWYYMRGPVEKRPGEAYQLPIGKEDAEWKTFSPQCDDE